MDQGFTLWFTGLSGAGKSTLANLAAEELRRRGHRVEILDGDEVRTNLSKGLGFSKEDRDTNIRRIGYVCNLLARNGVIAISAAISPYRDVRDEVRKLHTRFFEVFMKCPIENSGRARRERTLQKSAGRRDQESFTGVSDPYEEPVTPELLIDSSAEKVEHSLKKLLATLEERNFIPRHSAAESAARKASAGGSR